MTLSRPWQEYKELTIREVTEARRRAYESLGKPDPKLSRQPEEDEITFDLTDEGRGVPWKEVTLDGIIDQGAGRQAGGGSEDPP